MSAIVIPNASSWATKPLQTHEAPSQSPDGRGLRGSGETPIAWGERRVMAHLGWRPTIPSHGLARRGARLDGSLSGS
jgi:hypothetical protein